MYNDLRPRMGSTKCRATLPSFFCCLLYQCVLSSESRPGQGTPSEPVTGSVSEVNQSPGNLGDLSKWPGPRRQEYFSPSGNQLTGDTQSNGLSESVLALPPKLNGLWHSQGRGRGYHKPSPLPLLKHISPQHQILLLS